MNKNFLHKASLWGGLVGAILLFSCEKKDYTSYCPTWKGFTYTVNDNTTLGNPRNIVLRPGDELHITAHQDKKGHLIHATDYTWTICDNTNNEIVPDAESYSQHTNYDGYENGSDDPVGHLSLPTTMAAGKYYVRFVAQYTYSGQGITIVNGNIVDNTSYSGRITPQSGATGGGATGYFYFSVEE